MKASTVQNIEHKHDDVFGATFAMYDEAEMARFIEPFRIRFQRNKIDAAALFKGKKCLDAGCGNGRGSLFMAMNGATEIHSLDVSQTNVESTARNAKIFGFDNIIKPRLSTLENIDFQDETFDFVWCNGVLMHTHNPDTCLSELTRVLKTGGKTWIYVYGSGGVYWYSVYKIRDLLKDVSESKLIETLELLQTPVSFLAEYLDDWKAPYLRTYTDADFGGRMQGLGFENVTPQPFGTDYDTSHRINTYPADKVWLGEGDLRYLSTKTKLSNAGAPISDSVLGSYYDYPVEYTAILDEKFSQIEKKAGGNSVALIAAAAYLQRNLRDQIFASHEDFKMDNFTALFEDVINRL